MAHPPIYTPTNDLTIIYVGGPFHGQTARQRPHKHNPSDGGPARYRDAGGNPMSSKRVASRRYARVSSRRNTVHATRSFYELREIKSRSGRTTWHVYCWLEFDEVGWPRELDDEEVRGTLHELGVVK